MLLHLSMHRFVRGTQKDRSFAGGNSEDMLRISAPHWVWRAQILTEKYGVPEIRYGVTGIL